MDGINNFLGFLLAGIVMNITPGADSIYIITRSIAQGKKAGIYSVLGIVTGAVTHVLLSAFGLAAILAQSTMLFTAIKWVGAAYLIYLGSKMLLEKSNLSDPSKVITNKLDVRKIYYQGFLTNALNPKVALFFIALLPQFITLEHANSPIPFLILGGVFLCTGIVWCLFLVYTASLMTKTLRSNNYIGKLMKKISGFVFVGLGVKLLFE